MRIKVFSRERLFQAADLFSNKHAIISIQNKDDFKKCKTDANILYLKFDDVEIGQPGKAMSEDDATAIANFVLRNEDKDFFVSCNAGISRSSGTAAAISKLMNGDDSQFFKPPYCPNMHCYRYVYSALIRAQYKKRYGENNDN